MNELRLLNINTVEIPEKSLIELAYTLYKKAEKLPFVGDTKLKEIEITDLSHNWVRRLLNSRLLLKHKSRRKYLIYLPNIFFDSIIHTRDEPEFNSLWVKKIFPNSVVITSSDISPHTREGYVSTEIDVILSDRVIVEKLYNNAKSGIYFWHVPNAHRIHRNVLVAYTQFVRGEPRNLVNSYQLVRSMSKNEEVEFINLVGMSHVPSIIISFFCDVLGVEKPTAKPELLHPMFYENWEMALENNGYSGAMFVEYQNQKWITL